MYFLQELSLPILITASLQYLLSCFPLVFLEGCCTTLSSEEMLMTFFHLASTIWGASMSSKRAVSSAKTLSQNYFKYFTHFHLFSSSTSLYFSASSCTLALLTFFAFCIACLIQQVSAASFMQAWSFCSSSCCCYISQCCCSSIFASVWEMSEDEGEYMII